MVGLPSGHFPANDDRKTLRNVHFRAIQLLPRHKSLPTDSVKMTLAVYVYKVYSLLLHNIRGECLRVCFYCQKVILHSQRRTFQIGQMLSGGV